MSGASVIAALAAATVPHSSSSYAPRLSKLAPAEYVPDQDRAPRGVDRAAKRIARRKAVAWKGKGRRSAR